MFDDIYDEGGNNLWKRNPKLIHITNGFIEFPFPPIVEIGYDALSLALEHKVCIFDGKIISFSARNGDPVDYSIIEDDGAARILHCARIERMYDIEEIDD